MDDRTLDDCIEEAKTIIEQARAEHHPVKTFVLVSGGKDSMVLLDFATRHLDADAVVHVNTGIGIPQTNAFVREQVALTDLPLLEMHPPVPYDDLVLDPKYFGGFPGPDAHRFVYQRLKERCIRAVIREHRTKAGQRFMLLTGVRRSESARRMGYRNPVDRQGGQVWVNPLLFWDNGDMAEYRERYGVAVSEVTKHLHMSGECLCGAFAHPWELAEIGFFYPEVAARIRDLEDRAKALGLRACKWGERPPGSRSGVVGPMCASCEHRQEVMDLE